MWTILILVVSPISNEIAPSVITHLSWDFRLSCFADYFLQHGSFSALTCWAALLTLLGASFLSLTSPSPLLSAPPWVPPTHWCCRVPPSPSIFSQSFSHPGEHTDALTLRCSLCAEIPTSGLQPRPLPWIPGLGFQLPTSHLCSVSHRIFNLIHHRQSLSSFSPNCSPHNLPCSGGLSKLEAVPPRPPYTHIHKSNLPHLFNISSKCY